MLDGFASGQARDAIRMRLHPGYVPRTKKKATHRVAFFIPLTRPALS